MSEIVSVFIAFGMARFTHSYHKLSYLTLAIQMYTRRRNCSCTMYQLIYVHIKLLIRRRLMLIMLRWLAQVSLQMRH